MNRLNLHDRRPGSGNVRKRSFPLGKVLLSPPVTHIKNVMTTKKQQIRIQTMDNIAFLGGVKQIRDAKDNLFGMLLDLIEHEERSETIHHRSESLQYTFMILNEVEQGLKLEGGEDE